MVLSNEYTLRWFVGSPGPQDSTQDSHVQSSFGRKPLMAKKQTEEIQNAFEQGPYVQVAAFCERVLTEANRVLSLVRVVDVVTHEERRPDAPKEMPEVHYPLALVLMLKSGRARGRHEITIKPELPSGEFLPPFTLTVQLEGEGRGVNLVSQIDIPYKLEGLYWFNVYFDEVLLTRIPLEIRYSRLVAGSAAAPNP
jgi:hypothetical protein